MRRRLDSWVLAACAILLLAAGLRFYRLGAQSLWNDEGTSAALALRSLGTIARNAADDIHPPLYYWLLALWVRLTGTSEFALRSLSVLLGIGAVALTMWLARRWFSERTALLAGLLAAVSPLAVYYSQEARMYIPVTFFGVAATCALACVLPVVDIERPLRVRALALYGVLTLAMLYSHYYAATLLVAHNLAFLAWVWLRRPIERPRSTRDIRRQIGAWALTQAIIMACYVPWLAYAWHTIRYWPSISAPFTLEQLVLRLAQVLPLGITVHTSTWTLATGMAMAALALLGLTRPAESTVGQVEKAGRSKVRASRWWPVVTAALYAAVPVGAMYAASLRRPMYNPKFLLLATPAYGLLLARGLEALTSVARRLGRIAERLTLGIVLLAVLAPMGWSLYGLYANPAFFRDDYRGIVAYISAAAGPGDAILVDAPAQVETVDYYYQGAWPVYALPRMRPADRAATETELADILARHRRLYAIYWATDESDPEGIIENYLAAHAFKASDAWHGNVRLVVYDSVRQAPAEPEVSTAYRLGEAVVLEGYALLTPEIAAGDVAQVSLFWRADAPLKQSLKVFVHLVDANGAIIGQHDAEPAGSSRPTTSWAAGELVRDNHGILVQPGTPAGTVTLRVGLYDGATGKRLPVSLGGQPLGDAVDLVTLPLIAPAEPLPIDAFDVERRTEVSLMGMDVLGYSLYPLGLRHEARRSLRPGEAAELLLYARGPNMPLEARLERHGAAIVTVAYDALTAGVPSGHIARGTRQFTIPANAPVGRYRLVVTVGGQSASLGTVEIER